MKIHDLEKACVSSLILSVFQDILMEKDFNIGDEARGNGRPFVRSYNATVRDNALEIRLYWASKGTKRIPSFGVYGSLISAISVNPSKQNFYPFRLMRDLTKKSSLTFSFRLTADFKVCRDGEKKDITGYIVGPVIASFVIFLMAGILWWKCFRKHRSRLGKGDVRVLH